MRLGQRLRAGANTIETVIATGTTILILAATCEIAIAAYTGDRMRQAAQRGAEVMAVDPSSDPCAVVKAVLGAGPDTDCEDRWNLTVNIAVPAGTLNNEPMDNPGAGTGEMITIWLEWTRAPWAWETQGITPLGGGQTSTGKAMRTGAVARCETPLCTAP